MAGSETKCWGRTCTGSCGRFSRRREKKSKRRCGIARVWQGNLVQKTKEGRRNHCGCRKDDEPRKRCSARSESRHHCPAASRRGAARDREARGHGPRGRNHRARNQQSTGSHHQYLFICCAIIPRSTKRRDHCAAMAEQELQRVSHITRQTLSFYRESKTPSRPFTELLDDVLELQKRQFQSQPYRAAEEIPHSR